MQIKRKIRKTNCNKKINIEQKILKLREDLINEHIMTEQKRICKYKLEKYCEEIKATKTGERSSIKDINGNIVENIDDIKAFEAYYKALLKTNSPRNIFELQKDVFVNQQFSQFETVAKITAPTHRYKEEVMKVVRS